jgi:hypothetical protein
MDPATPLRFAQTMTEEGEFEQEHRSIFFNENPI